MSSPGQWWDKPWNPTYGCTKVSEECRRCWAESMDARFHKGEPFSQVRTMPHLLDKPLRTKEPTRYFVCNMSDLFHEKIPTDYIHEVYAVMTLAHWHQFFVCTKRPERALEIFTDPDCYERRLAAADRVRSRFRKSIGKIDNVGFSDPTRIPPSNIAFGVTAGNQRRANERIPIALRIPAAKLFVSYEPALGPIDFTNIELPEPFTLAGGVPAHINALTDHDDEHFYNDHRKLDWIIAGGENDSDAAECHLDWLRSATNQCACHDVKVLIKQLGSRPVVSEKDESVWPGYVSLLGNGFGMYFVRGLKKVAGKDPQEWPMELRVQQMLDLNED